VAIEKIGSGGLWIVAGWLAGEECGPQVVQEERDEIHIQLEREAEI